MALALSIFLVRILDCDLFGHDVLVVHAGNSRVRGLEVAVGYEAVALGCRRDFVARNLWRIHQWSESAECVVQGLFIYAWVEITHEQLRADFNILLLVGGCLVNAYPTSVESDIVQNLGGVVGFGFCVEFNKAETLVLAVDAIDWHVNVSHTTGVEHQLVEDTGCNALMEVSDIYGGFLVLLPAWQSACVHVFIMRDENNLPVTGAWSRHGARFWI